MTYGYNSLANYQNAYSSQPDIQIPKNTQQSLGLRQIKDFDVIENFQDANGKNWRLVKNFTPQMISQSEWHRANVYSSELVDARMSKFIALCKLCKPGTSKPVLENSNIVKEEYIEDICLEVGTGTKE